MGTLAAFLPFKLVSPCDLRDGRGLAPGQGPQHCFRSPPGAECRGGAGSAAWPAFGGDKLHSSRPSPPSPTSQLCHSPSPTDTAMRQSGVRNIPSDVLQPRAKLQPWASRSCRLAGTKLSTTVPQARAVALLSLPWDTCQGQASASCLPSRVPCQLPVAGCDHAASCDECSLAVSRSKPLGAGAPLLHLCYLPFLNLEGPPSGLTEQA